jgi:hypothetical protein
MEGLGSAPPPGVDELHAHDGGAQRDDATNIAAILDREGWPPPLTFIVK